MDILLWLLLLSSMSISGVATLAPEKAVENGEHLLFSESQVPLVDDILPSPNSPSNPAPRFPDLHPFIQKYRLPGLTIGWSNGNAFHSQVAGLRKVGHDTPIMTTDQFHIGSLGKAMTSTLLALLIKDGNFSWETKLGDIFPDLNHAMAVGHKGTTLMMLTSHRSGIAIDLRLHPQIWNVLWDLSITPEQGRWIIVNHALSTPPANRPGTFTYENTNFLIAGAIVDRYTPYTYEELLQNRLFSPLQMEGCGFGPCEEHSDISLDNPWPHTPNPFPGQAPIPVAYLPHVRRDTPPAFNSAGRVHCTMPSYNKFLLLHATALDGREDTLGLSQEQFEVLHTPYWGPGDSKDAKAYTPGAWNWHNTSSRADEYSLSHEGSNTMNQAIAWINISPVHASTIMTMTNVGGGEADEATRAVIAKMRGI